MPPKTKDFRSKPFSINAISISGRDVGENCYWKLYAIENYFRVIVHTILTRQIPGPDWWILAVDDDTKEYAEAAMKNHSKRPWHGSRGSHPIYYITIGQLITIFEKHLHLIAVAIVDADIWLARLKEIKLPRHVICHMNFDSEIDRKRIDVMYADTFNLMRKLEDEVSFLIP